MPKPARSSTSSDTVFVIAALVGPLLIWAIVFGFAGIALSPDLGPGECHGIGFGCTLSPREGVWFVGFYLGVFVVPLAAVLTALGGVLAPDGLKPATVVTLLSIFLAATLGFVGWLLLNARPR